MTELSVLEIRRAQTKPVEVQTVLATIENMPMIMEWITGRGHAATLGEGQLIIQTLEGPFTVRPGDQVIYGPTGFTRHEGGEFFESAYDDLGPVQV